jgi:hypothetical protein
VVREQEDGIAGSMFGLLGGLSISAYNNRAVRRIRKTFFRHLAIENGHIPVDRRNMAKEDLSFAVTPLESADSGAPTKYHVTVTNLALLADETARTAEFLYDQRTQKLAFEALIG